MNINNYFAQFVLCEIFIEMKKCCKLAEVEKSQIKVMEIIFGIGEEAGEHDGDPWGANKLKLHLQPWRYEAQVQKKK